MSAVEFLARGILLVLIVWMLAHVWVSCGEELQRGEGQTNKGYEVKALIHDLRAAFAAALNEWHRCRWLRTTGGCPDNCQF